MCQTRWPVHSWTDEVEYAALMLHRFVITILIVLKVSFARQMRFNDAEVSSG